MRSPLMQGVMTRGGALLSALSFFIPAAFAGAVQIQSQTEEPRSLQAEYEITELDRDGVAKHSRLVNVYRSKDRVYRAYPKHGVAEMWQRSNRGALQYRRIYFRQKLVVEYGETDTTLLGSYAAFPGELQLIDPRLDPHWRAMPGCGEKSSVEGKALCYGSAGVELYWLSEQALPLSATWSHGEHHYQLALRSLKPLDFAPVAAELDTFEYIDFADIGDNEAHSGLGSINTGQFNGTTYSHSSHH